MTPGPTHSDKRNLADRAAVGIEVFLAVHMGGQVDAGVADRTVAAHTEELAAHPLGVGHAQGNVVQPLRGLDAERNGHIEHLGFLHGGEELALAHAIRGRVGADPRPGSFNFHVRDRHDGDPGALVLQLVDLAHDAFRQHQVRLGHRDMGQIVVLALREVFIPGLAGFLL